MPADFIGKPEKVHRAIEAKKELENVLTETPVVVEAQDIDETVSTLELLQL